MGSKKKIMFLINNKKDKFFKILLIFNFFLLLGALEIILRTGPAISYEFSIYDAYPWYFWVLILSAIVCGQLIILGSAVTQSSKIYYIFGLFAILIANTILLFMTVIRGYLVNNDGDILTHIGIMKDILQTSNIGSNYYPIDHILGVILHLFSGLPLALITQIIPPFFSFLFILSIYFIGKIFFPDKFTQLIFILTSLVWMITGSAELFTPNAQAFSLVPLILYSAFKIYDEADNKKYYILFLLVSFLIVFYHPLVTVMVILILCLIQFVQYILEKFGSKFLNKVNYVYSIFFMVILFTMWSTYIQLLAYTMRPIFETIVGNEVGHSELQQNVAVVSQVAIDPLYLLKLIFNIYGQYILIGIFSLLTIGLIFNFVKEHKRKPDLYLGIPVFGFIIFSILSVIMLSVNNTFGFGRIFVFACLFSILLVPTGVFYILYSDKCEKSDIPLLKVLKFSMIILFFFSLTYFSIFNLYPSPNIKVSNPEVTKSEYTGMNTFFSYRNVALPILEYLPSSYRYYDAIYGTKAEKINIGYYSPYSTPLDHFGFQNVNLSRSFLNETRYLLIDAKGRGFYPHIYPEFKDRWRFLPEDFERLNFDINIQKVYSNRNLEIYIT
jgi:hypothetical protein